MEENKIKSRIYREEEREYEKERMYWLGYCLQAWSNRANLPGKEIAKIFGEAGIEYLLRNYKVYHTVDPMYVLEDLKDCLNIFENK